MLRRQVVSLVLGALAGSFAKASGSLRRFLEPDQGAALLLDVRARRLIAVNDASVAGRSLVRPGSTLKPFVLTALMRRGKLSADTTFPCPGRLTIGNRRLDCSHPPLATPLRADTAIAYSCNCFVAHFAERFEPGELARELGKAGLTSRSGLFGDQEATGQLQPAATSDAQRVQALGESNVLITAAELAVAYRQLAIQIASPEMTAILAGLEGAVEFGTAQNARVMGTRVAGKTGTSTTTSGGRVAWFAGFMPSRAPEVVVTVMLAGHSGGADAAPVAGQILEAYRTGKI